MRPQLLLLAALSASSFAAAPQAETARRAEAAAESASARAAWRAGRPEEAERRFERALELEPASLPALLDLAVVLRDLGRPGEGLPHLLKAGLIAPKDPAIVLEQGWAQLSQEQFDGARDAFGKVLSGPAPEALRSEARLGRALAAWLDRGDAAAIEPLEDAAAADPSQAAAAAYALGQAQASDRRAAMARYAEAAGLDPESYEARSELALLQEAAGDNAAALQSLDALLRRDPGDAGLQARFAKALKFYPADPDALLGPRRIPWPLTDKPEAPGPSAPLTVALFAGAGGRPALLESFRFICNSDFKLEDEVLGTAATGKARAQWELRLRPGRGLYEFYDNHGELKHASSGRVRIVPLAPGGTVLVKGAVSKDWGGADPGDRDLRGALLLTGRAQGFTATLETTLEAYVPGVVALMLPESAAPEALKASAVQARAEALQNSKTRHPGQDWGLCDSKHCALYLGLSAETPEARKAVHDTRGETLSGPGGYDHQLACGGASESGGLVLDSDSEPWKAEGPWDLERSVRSQSAPDLWCALSGRVSPVDLRWLRLLKVEDLLVRAKPYKVDRAPLALTPLGRSPSGRLEGLRWTWDAGSRDFTGPELEALLSPGSLRSRAVALWPLFAGRRVRWLLVWGAGTGGGKGYCAAGAAGMAARKKSYREILAHYYPAAKVVGLERP